MRTRVHEGIPGRAGLRGRLLSGRPPPIRLGEAGRGRDVVQLRLVVRVELANGDDGQMVLGNRDALGPDLLGLIDGLGTVILRLLGKLELGDLLDCRRRRCLEVQLPGLLDLVARNGVDQGAGPAVLRTVDVPVAVGEVLIGM